MKFKNSPLLLNTGKLLKEGGKKSIWAMISGSVVSVVAIAVALIAPVNIIGVTLCVVASIITIVTPDYFKIYDELFVIAVTIFKYLSYRASKDMIKKAVKQTIEETVKPAETEQSQSPPKEPNVGWEKANND